MQHLQATGHWTILFALALLAISPGRTSALAPNTTPAAVSSLIVSDIRFTANTSTGLPSVPAADLIARMKTRIGQTLNESLFKRDLASLFDHRTGEFAKQGYLADVGPGIDMDKKTGVITIPIVQYHIKSIHITGNRHVKTADILARMHTKVGDLYDSNGLGADESAIYEMGKFRQVTAYTWRTVAPGEAGITIPVVEQPTAVGSLNEKQGKIIPFLYDPVTVPYPVIEVSVNGKPPLPFIVDTGSSPALSLDPWAVQALGLKANGPMERENGFVVSQTSLRGIVLQGTNRHNDAAFSTREAAIIDLGLLAQFSPGQRIAGIVGLGLLSPITSRFDFAAKTLTLFVASHPPLQIPGGTILPMRGSADGLFTVRTTLAPETFADLIIDTGSDSTEIPVSALPALHPTAASYSNFGERLDSIYISPTLRLPDLTLGTLPVPDVVVGTLPPHVRLSLGMNILAGYRLTLDGPNGQATLETLAHSERYVPSASNLNVTQTDGRWLVSALADAAPAHHAGLQIGDEILTVGGVGVKDFSWVEMQRMLGGIVGIPVQVSVRQNQGTEKTFSWDPIDNFSISPTPMDGLAMTQAPGSPWVIMDVEKGCPGDKAGLHIGDQISSIAGATVIGMPLNRYAELTTQPVVILEIERAGLAHPLPAILFQAR
jgi:hypothetical protein